MNTYKIGFESLGVDLSSVRRNTSICPKCSHTRKKKHVRCMSVNLLTGNYHCNHCGEKGRVDSDAWILKNEGRAENEIKETLKATENELKRIMEYNNKTEKPKFTSTPLTQNLIDWFWDERKISESTLIARGVQCELDGYGNEWIAFNNTFEGEVVNAKYRTIGDKDSRKFKSHVGVEAKDKHLYGIDYLMGRNTAIIVEGEIDALTLHECGIDNVVSIIMGAEQPPKNWKEGQDVPLTELNTDKLIDLRNDLNILKGMRRVIIAVDNDLAGKYLCQKLLQILGKDRCLIVDWGVDNKDANGVLVQYGKEAVCDYIKAAKHLPIKGVVECEDVYSNILDIRRNGYKKGVKVGIKEIDDHFSFVKGWWNLFTGIPNSGKSVFLMYIMCIMSYRKGWKWAVFSAEHYPAEDFYLEVMEIMAHKPLSQMTEDEVAALAIFVHEHFFYIYFDAEEGGNTLDNILKSVVTQALLKDIDGFLIDPFNQMDVSLEEMGMPEHKYLQMALSKIDVICKRYDICGNIISHPKNLKKGLEEQDYPCPTGYDISGGAMWINKSYTLSAIHRPFNQSDKQDPSIEFNVQKIKSYKRAGSPAVCHLDYLNGWYVGRGLDETASPLYGALQYLVSEYNGQIVVEEGWDDDEEIPF